MNKLKNFFTNCGWTEFKKDLGSDNFCKKCVHNCMDMCYEMNEFTDKEEIPCNKEKFRSKLTEKVYCIDCCHYVRLPSEVTKETTDRCDISLDRITKLPIPCEDALSYYDLCGSNSRRYEIRKDLFDENGMAK